MAESEMSNVNDAGNHPVLLEPEPYRLTVMDRVRGFGGSVRSFFRKDPTPAWVSFWVLIMAGAPGIVELVTHHRRGEYDPTIAVLTATLIALVWTAHYTYRAVKRSEFEFERTEAARTRARLAILGSISAELGFVRDGLDVVANPTLTVAASQWLSTPQLSQGLTRTDLLNPGEAHRLTLLSNAIRAIVSTYELIKAVEASSSLSKSDLDAAKARNRQTCERAKTLIDTFTRYAEQEFSFAGLPEPSKSA